MRKATLVTERMGKLLFQVATDLLPELLQTLKRCWPGILHFRSSFDKLYSNDFINPTDSVLRTDAAILFFTTGILTLVGLIQVFVAERALETVVMAASTITAG